MLGKALETFFIYCWVTIKLSLFFWLFSLAGGIVLGVGPALKTVTELFLTHQFDYKEITVIRGWEIFKRDFKRGNGLFWLFAGIIAILGYNLFLSLQIQGLPFLVIDFILLFVLLYLLSSYQYALLFDSSYEMNFKSLLKLSFISSFSSFFSFLKLIIGSIFILVLTWKYKGLLLFGMIGLLVIWSFYATKPWRVTVEGRLQ